MNNLKVIIIAIIIIVFGAVAIVPQLSQNEIDSSSEYMDENEEENEVGDYIEDEEDISESEEYNEYEDSEYDEYDIIETEENDNDIVTENDEDSDGEYTREYVKKYLERKYGDEYEVGVEGSFADEYRNGELCYLALLSSKEETSGEWMPTENILVGSQTLNEYQY